MSVALYIVTQREIEGLDTFVDGKAIGRASEKTLDRICQSIGQPSLYHFVSQDPQELDEFMEDAGLDLPEDLPPEQWFRPEEGHQCIAALLAFLQDNPDAIENADAIAQDLVEYLAVLDALAPHGVLWHFAVDF